MNPEALTNAEKACREELERTLHCPVHRFANPGSPDCAVFDAGAPRTGDLFLDPSAATLHFRASLAICRRDHDELQREIMRLVSRFPVSADSNADDDLRARSNVVSLRIAPEANAVSAISVSSVEPPNGGAAIPCYAVDVALDLVFAVSF